MEKLFSGITTTEELLNSDKTKSLGNDAMETPQPKENNDNNPEPYIFLGESEEKALNYIAGCLACQVKGEHPDLITEARQSDRRIKGWIEKVSRGELVIPLESFIQKLGICEGEFIKVHGTGIDHDPAVIGRLIKTIENLKLELPGTAISRGNIPDFAHLGE